MTDMNTSNRDYNADSNALMGNTDARNTNDDSTTHRVGEKVRQFANTAQSRASEQVRTQLDSGKSRAAGTLRDVASSLMHPNEAGDDAVSRYMRTAGDQVQRAADYLENADVQEVVGDVERFARRQPALFLGGAFMVGLLAARVLKSSRRPGDMNSNDNWQGRSMYDRERSLDSYREPSSNFGSAGVGAAGAALGGAPLGDNSALDNTNTGLAGGTGRGTSASGGSLGSSGGIAGTDTFGRAKGAGSDPYANE